MNYEISGLSRSPLERSVATEMLATQLLHKIAHGAARLSRLGASRADRPRDAARGSAARHGDGFGDELAEAHHRGVHRQRQHRRADGSRVDLPALRRDHRPVLVERDAAARGSAASAIEWSPSLVWRACWKK